MKRASTKPAAQMAYLTIGTGNFLMEASKAMKVAELMQHAVNAEWDWRRESREMHYTVGDHPNVEFRFVRADQIHIANGEPAPVLPAKPRLLR